MTMYYVIKETGSNSHRACQYQPEFTDGGHKFPNHYWDIDTEEIVLECDAYKKFMTNDEWLARDTAKEWDKVTA